MPSESPLRPKLQKGALAVYPTHTPGSQPSTLIVFQYNPEAMKRTLAHRATTAPNQGTTGAAKEDAVRAAGPPLETINVTVDMHAADQLAEPDKNGVVAEFGLHPALAALEVLMYPPTVNVQKIEEQAARGQVQVNPPEVPLLLLVWGKARVVPVKLTTFAVSEEAFDTRLNPIAAKVELGMQVLTSSELTASSVGRDVFATYQKTKETLAGLNRLSSVATGVSTLLPR